MNRFFSRLLEKNTYGELLREHLDGYVEEIVRKKYHILKTSDNFYQYKSDIKVWLKEMEEKENEALKSLLEEEQPSNRAKIEEKERNLSFIDEIRRGFADIERRISNMDREHMKYVRATVTRMNYLMNSDRDMKGLMIDLLNQISGSGQKDAMLDAVAKKVRLEHLQVLSPHSLYRKRKGKKNISGGA